MFNKKVMLALLMMVAINAFNIETEELDAKAPETHVGDSSVACNPNSAPRVTAGFATKFNDDKYKCERWSGKAYSSSECFVALNGICGMENSKFCDKCVNVVNGYGKSIKCRIIDFCDPKDCDFYDPGHLDVLTNNGGANYRYIDTDKTVTPIPSQGPQPKTTWSYTSC